MNEKLGNRIKELRSAKQFTQEQIAEQIGDGLIQKMPSLL